MVAEVSPECLDVREVHRFATPLSDAEGLRWDFAALWEQITEGLSKAARTGRIDAVGVDSWGVDYGLVGAGGELLGDPFCYRDDRTVGAPEEVWGVVASDGLYRATGVQHQRFNTVFQLWADRRAGRLSAAGSVLLIPDLIAYKLTGRRVAEATNASTTGLFDPTRRVWSSGLIGALGFPAGLFPDVVEPGAVLGALTPEARAATGLGADCVVVAVGSHDTASAVAAAPAASPGFAYISSGTWSLVGVELGVPVITEAGRAANFANELGVFGTVRYLRNVMGLWLLTECQKHWAAQGRPAGLGGLLAAAAALEPARALIDPDSDEFLAPGNMPARIAAAAARGGVEPPGSPPQVARVIVDSLAAAYARAVREASALAGRGVEAIHVVGGGSLNRLLCQATADTTGLPVLAGPVEASAIGNALIQACALGALPANLPTLRRLVAATMPTTAYQPSTPRPDHPGTGRGRL